MIDLITLSAPDGVEAEAYQGLRTNIEFASIECPLRTLLVTSSENLSGNLSGTDSDDGESLRWLRQMRETFNAAILERKQYSREYLLQQKSTALANLAVVLAQTGSRVIIVDGDLRRPQQHEIFGLDNQSGLAEWLEQGGTPNLQGTEVKNLQILTAGTPTKSPAALLTSKSVGEVLEQLQTEADYVLCDAPPVLAVADSTLWASKVDGVLLLINTGYTRRYDAQRAKSMLEKVDANIVGSVLLNADPGSVVSGY